MPDEATIQTLHDQLFAHPETKVYAILDGAATPGLLDQLYGGPRPDFVCLFRGALAPDMAEVAPYLAVLEPDSAFTRWILGGWGRHRGIFAVSQAELWQLRNHFRSLVTAYGPKGRPLKFRFYDPRVLRVFLPSCDRDQMNAIFGPVLNYCLEAEDANALLRFRPDPRGPRADSIVLATPTET
ncbi:DUF4123 domain-containing protein [bacterium]|nr:DUF4123 domain-containing protein [bacterium]